MSKLKNKNVWSELTVMWFLRFCCDRTTSRFLGRVMTEPLLCSSAAVCLFLLVSRLQAGHQNLVGLSGLGRQLDHLVVVILRAPHVSGRSEIVSWGLSLCTGCPPDLSAVVVEDAHQADGHGLVDAVSQSLPGQGKDEGHGLLPTRLDDGVERLVQAACEGHSLSPPQPSPPVLSLPYLHCHEAHLSLTFSANAQGAQCCSPNVAV